MCELYHYLNRTVHFPRKIRCVSCIINLTGLPTVLEEIKRVSCIIMLAGLQT